MYSSARDIPLLSDPVPEVSLVVSCHSKTTQDAVNVYHNHYTHETRSVRGHSPTSVPRHSRVEAQGPRKKARKATSKAARLLKLDTIDQRG